MISRMRPKHAPPRTQTPPGDCRTGRIDPVLAGLGGGTWLAAERSNSERRASVAQVIGEARQKQKAAREAPADVPVSVRSPGGRRASRRVAVARWRARPEARNRRAAGSITTERDLAQAESEWSAQLADIRSTKAESLDGAAPDQSYAFIFRAAGIDPDVLSAAQVGARIRTRRPTVAEALVAHWTTGRPYASSSETTRPERIGC